MRFGPGLAFIFSESWAFIRQAWWLALLPTLPLLIYTITYPYLQPTWTEAAFWSALVLTAALRLLRVYCVVRFLALGHDLAGALEVNRASARTFAPYLAFIGALELGLLTVSDLYPNSTTWWTLVTFAFFAFPLLGPWTVTAPSGSAVIGPIRSIKLVLPHLIWGMAIAVVATMPVSLAMLALTSAIATLPEVPVGEQSLRFLIAAAADAVFNAVLDLVFIVTLFVIAHKAGVRISEDRRLAVVFE